MMPYVYVNKLGLIASHGITDAKIKIEVSEEEYDKITTYPAGKIWQYDFNTKTFELVDSPVLDDLRFAREVSCFPVINRGQGWYEMLSDEQKAELKAWYKSWLDITETRKIPEIPDWLKNKK